MGQGKSKTVTSVAKPREYNRMVGAPDPFAVSDKDLGIDEDSYIYSEEYKILSFASKKATEEYFELQERGKTIEHYKPRDQWSDMDKFMFEEFRDRPIAEEYSNYLKEVTRLSNKMDEAQEKLSNYEKEATRNRPRLIGIPTKDFKGKSRYIDITTTGTSYYDDFLDPSQASYLRSKGLEGKVVSMSPKEYLQRCADQIFGSSTYERQIRALNRANVKKYSIAMKSGSKAPLLYLNLSHKGTAQEGRHRAGATMLLGEEQIPVLVVYDV